MAAVCAGVILSAAARCASRAATGEAFYDLPLEHLWVWEDTPTTKDLPHAWRIYRRFL